MGAMLGRIVNDYPGLLEVCRQRAAELELSRSGIDDISGLATGLAGKILGDKQKKRLGILSLGLILETLGLRMLIIEDEAATARTLKLRTPVTKTQQRFGNTCNSPSKQSVPKLAPPEKPPERPPVDSRAHLRVIQGKKRGSKWQTQRSA